MNRIFIREVKGVGVTLHNLFLNNYLYMSLLLCQNFQHLKFNYTRIILLIILQRHFCKVDVITK